ncbi:MAG TPA: hypothetical protein VHD90_02015 [Phototrophicaceae bacterium]|nr:hypothetical protein [Phototrophicaceae bacterium]
MFEPHYQPLLPRRQFLRRMGRYALAAGLLVAVAWAIGILGYRITEGMGWTDAILNSAMILGGMGPVNPLKTVAGKLFASVYALFSGIVFLVAVGVLVAPLLHRALHQFHLAPPKDDSDDDDDDADASSDDDDDDDDQPTSKRRQTPLSS